MSYGDFLTDPQLRMVIASGEDREGRDGFGVELRGTDWIVAKKLVAMGFGWIEGGKQNGSELPGLYFNNEHGVAVLHENDDFVECPSHAGQCRLDCGCT